MNKVRVGLGILLALYPVVGYALSQMALSANPTEYAAAADKPPVVAASMLVFVVALGLFVTNGGKQPD